MIEFGAPQWLWLLAAVPATAATAAWVWRRRHQATAAWAARGLWDRLLPGYQRQRLAIWNLLLTIAVAGVVLALARPRWGFSEQQVERRGVDVVFVLDTSLSMATDDVEPSRLWIAQTLIRRLVQELAGHRVALVQAEGDGVVMAPLTVDGAVIDILLDSIRAGSLPTPGTELGQALERARSLFPNSDDGSLPLWDSQDAPGWQKAATHRALVLLSDGEDHGSDLGRMSPRLRQAGIVVHSVGVGTRQGKPLELPQLHQARGSRRSGETFQYKRDAAGNVVVSRLIEENLEQLSRETGGIYLRASNAAVDLNPIVGAVEAMANRSYGDEVIQTRGERFQWPAGAAILALALHLSLSPFRPNPPSGGRR